MYCMQSISSATVLFDGRLVVQTGEYILNIWNGERPNVFRLNLVSLVLLLFPSVTVSSIDRLL